MELIDKILLWGGAIAGLLSASYVIALLIPGEQPDKSIKWLMDVTSILSRKKKKPEA